MDESSLVLSFHCPFYDSLRVLIFVLSISVYLGAYFYFTKHSFLFISDKQLCCTEAAKGRFSPIFKNEDTEVWKVRNIPTQTSPWHTVL